MVPFSWPWICTQIQGNNPCHPLVQHSQRLYVALAFLLTWSLQSETSGSTSCMLTLASSLCEIWEWHRQPQFPRGTSKPQSSEYPLRQQSWSSLPHLSNRQKTTTSWWLRSLCSVIASLGAQWFITTWRALSDCRASLGSGCLRTTLTECSYMLRLLSFLSPFHPCNKSIIVVYR